MLIYDRLSFLDYDFNRPRLDTEWLLSTLFDASLLSTSKAAGNGGSFFVCSAAIPERFQAKWAPVRVKKTRQQKLVPPHAGNHNFGCRWTLDVPRAMICSS
jgi:hypothetical protein